MADIITHTASQAATTRAEATDLQDSDTEVTAATVATVVTVATVAMVATEAMAATEVATLQAITTLACTQADTDPSSDVADGRDSEDTKTKLIKDERLTLNKRPN